MHLVYMNYKFLDYPLLLIFLFGCFFNNGYAQVKVEQELIFNDDTLFIFNQNGKRGLGKDTNNVDFKYDSIRLGGDFNLVKENGKWGTISDDNKIAIPLKYDELQEVRLREILIARKSNKWGVIEEDDQVLIPFKYSKIVGVWASKDLFFVEKNGKWGLINEKDKVLLPFEYDSLGKGYNIKIKEEAYETIIVKKNGKFGIVNNKNKILLPVVYDEIMSRSEYGPNGYYVLVNGKKGFVNEEGKLMIPYIYDAINYNYNVKLFRIKQDNKYGLVNEHNKPFLPLTFTKLYLDIPFFYDDTEANGKIVVQKMDSGWQYLNVKDGSILQDNVPKDSVFKYYKTELFGEELMTAYLQKVQRKEGMIADELDTFHQRLIDEIIASKSGVQIDFPDLHKTPINFMPRSWQLRSIFKIRSYLLSRGFEVETTGQRLDESASGRQWCLRISLPDRECLFEISFHKTYTKDEYKIIESLKCTERNNSYMRIPRYHDLHQD